MPNLSKNDISLYIQTIANTKGAEEATKVIADLDGHQKSAAKSAEAFSTALKVTTVAAIAIAVGIGESVKKAGDFQASITRLETSAGESKDNLGKVSQGILQLARDTGTTTDELTKAMYTVESAGQHGANGLEVLKAAAQGAKAENADVATVADAVSSVLQDYHLKASDAALVTSKLVVAISDGKTTFEQFSSSLSAVLPIASAAHVSLSDVTAALASMTVHGMSADQASQNLAHTIQKMQSPTQAMTKYLAQIGISSNDLAGSLGKKGITGTLQDISKAIMEHMGPDGRVLVDAFNKSKVAAEDANKMIAAMPTSLQALAKNFQSGKITLGDFRRELKALPVDQANLLTQFASLQNSASGFNSMLKSGSPAAKTYAAALYSATGDATSLNTALMLTGENTDYVNKAVKDVTNATAEAGGNVRGWAEVQGNFNTKMQQFQQVVDTSAISLGMVFLPAATDVLSGVVDLSNAVGTFTNQHAHEMEVAFTSLATAAGTFAIGNLVSGLYSFVAAGGIATVAARVLAGAMVLLDAVNPIVAGFSILAGLLTVVGMNSNGATSASSSLSAALDRQKRAQQELTQATRDAKNAENELTHSKLDAEGASLRVEEAQRSLTRATQQYGPASLQAREASHQLKVAQQDLADANQRVKDTTNAAKDAETKKNAAFRDAVNANNSVASAARNAAGGYQSLANAISNARDEDRKNGTFLKNETNVIFGIKNKHATGSLGSAGGRTLVGENGPEVVDLPPRSVVHTTHESGKMMAGGKTENHFHGNIILQTAGAAKEFFDQLDQDSLLSKNGMTANRGY